MARIPDEVVEQLRIWDAEKETMSPRQIGAKRISEAIEKLQISADRHQDAGALELMEALRSVATFEEIDEITDAETAKRILWNISHLIGLSFAIGAGASVEESRRLVGLIQARNGALGGNASVKTRRKDVDTWTTLAMELAREIQFERPFLPQKTITEEIELRWKPQWGPKRSYDTFRILVRKMVARGELKKPVAIKKPQKRATKRLR